MVLAHGGENGTVSLIRKGLVTFGYMDAAENYQVLSILLPGRLAGDMDVLEPTPYRIIVQTLKPIELLTISRDEWLRHLRGSVETMETYTRLANRCHQSVMDGMIANYTRPLEQRLRTLILSLITEHYAVKPSDWNPCPVTLSVTDLAQIVSASRSWVSRTLSAWIEEGMARKDGRLLFFRGELFRDLIDERG
ncbi:Crp/Fnr family transcriptional regulator [Sutterella sp.]|uniref:Crp/Fnr family transcriptional regulator n=1 Tax=Sutterella sp. TaxID=1981025 RepID=UPI0026E03943|nr:Crp/Fnr family transcriptional regulator [Sutterella sp.]MDO5532478.1 Crp/Fnr family transcriptional regulator [Sutterella sp.]